MKRNAHDVPGERGDLSQFSKNRFFKGKLMTPQIMRDARSYHSERLHTQNRFIDGKGIVQGLEVESVSEAGEELEVRIGAGLAIDGYGRPVVAERATTKTLPGVDGDELYLFIQYDEVDVESVPVPDTDGAADGETVPNRMVETFALTHRESPPESRAAVPEFDVAELCADESDPAALAEKLSAAYHDHHRTDPTDETDPAVYVGAFERTHDGAWVESTAGPGRSFVYDHDMLFGLLVEHIADTDNPHRTPVHEPVDPQPDDVAALNDRLDAVESTIDGLERERDAFVRYALRKTIKDRARFFERLSERVEQQSGEVSRLARELARMSTDDPLSGQQMETEYRQQLSNAMDRLVRIGDSLEGIVTEDSLERYLRSVSQLQSALESESDLLELLDADNEVCETADSLDVLVDVVPDA